MNWKKCTLVGVGVFVAPFVLYGWWALIAKFLNVVFAWSGR